MDFGHVNLAVVGSLLLWINVQFLLDVSGVTPRFGQFVSVKTVHTFVVLGLLGIQYMVNIVPNVSEFYSFLIILSAGFFLYHFLKLYESGTGLLLYLHHITTVTILIYVLRYRNTALDRLTILLGSSLIMEPLLVFKRDCKVFDLYSDVLKCIVNWTYASSFSMIRLGWGVMVANDLLCTDVDMIVKALLIVIFIMNIVFSCRILIKLAYDGLCRETIVAQ